MTGAPRTLFQAAAKGGRLFFRRDGLVYSAAIAFNVLLSAVPVLFLVFAATSLLVGRDELPYQALADMLRKAVPYGTQVIVSNVRKVVESGTTFGVAGTVMLLLASFNATAAVHASLAVMMGRPRKRELLKGAAFHAALVLALIVLVSVVIVFPPLWKGLSLFPVRLPRRWNEPVGLLVEIVSQAVLAALTFLGCAASYIYLAPRPVKPRRAFGGGLAFVAMMFALKEGISFYVRKFARLSLIYGSLFRIVSFIIVTYLFAAAYLYCASVIGMLESNEGRATADPGKGTGAGEGRDPGGD